MHQILDDGRAYCAECRTLVPAGDHCGDCGAVLRPKPERPAMACPNQDCDVVTTTRFCPECGSRVLGEVSERIWRGDVKVGDLVEQLTLKHWAAKDAAAKRNEEVAPP